MEPAVIMAPRISRRIAEFVDALPLADGMRVLEIGCGPGVAAREVARRIGNGHVVAIDRSAKAVGQATAGSAELIEAGVLSFRRTAIDEFELEPGEDAFDLAFAMRVGALDGRHPEAGREAMTRIRSALRPHGRLYVDGGSPLKQIPLPPRHE
jgi:SAM-dependent methyltransferase